MTTLALAGGFAALLMLAAVSGPWLIRRAAHALAHVPRSAAGLLAGVLAVWGVAMLALGPMVAWAVSGPAVLPGRVGQVCQRCLIAASPFDSELVDTAVPVVLLLVVPAVVALAVAGATFVGIVRSDRATRSLSDEILAAATRVELHGYSVLLVEDPLPRAFALPRRRGGVVISTGTIEALECDELAAVLVHEQAHLDQGHHALAVVVEALARPLKWVPLVAAIAGALPHYLEIAADDSARREVGTPALAGALLTLGESGTDVRFAGEGTADGSVLHAVRGVDPGNPDRVGHLVSGGGRVGGRWPSLVIAGYFAVLAAAGSLVHGPYVAAVVAGCV